MPSVFTRIFEGQIPGRIVWKDEICFAILSNKPLRPGHTLVIPRHELDHWIDLEPSLATHMFGVAQCLGKAIQSAFQPTKVGVVIAGLEVNHVHIHLVPMDSANDLNFANANAEAAPQELDRVEKKLTESLRSLGLYPPATH